MPDFETLGVELKTVPIDQKGRPRESTYVTTVPLRELATADFMQSSLHHKLRRVLFVPVEAHAALPLPVRRVGTALLWRPDSEDLGQLEADWAAFSARMAEAGPSGLGPELGEVLQVRPKGADSKDTTWALCPEGHEVRTMRRGFYLRPRFVYALFARHFHMPR